MHKPKRIIISRTDNIGDVILTLPMAGLLKQLFPGVHILFLGKSYTKAVVDCCEYVDEFLDWSTVENERSGTQAHFLDKAKADTIVHVFPRREIARAAKNAGIPNRIGVSRRLYHSTTCNIRPNFSRRNSEAHEAQLNMKLLEPLGAKQHYWPDEIQTLYGFTQIKPLPEKLKKHIAPKKFNLILHPTSNGSAKEWGFTNYQQLMDTLDPHKVEIFITGSPKDAELIKNGLTFNEKNVHNLSGQMSLEELISFIAQIDGLVACSTGPLHIAAALGKKAVGLYSPQRPIHPGRWKPIGVQSKTLIFDPECPKCATGKECDCITKIKPERVIEALGL